MRMLVFAAICAAAGTAKADGPRVATDILPVHGLVSRVMDGVGAPDLIVDPGASPHGYAMRPSQARALEAADLVVIVGAELTPWIVDPLATLAPGAGLIALMDVDGTLRLANRDQAADDEDGHGEHAHDDSENGGEDHSAEDHDASDHAHEDHAHGPTDPHAWLDPENAALWLDAIARGLGEIDPSNAETYVANAAAGRAEIEAAVRDVESRLAPVAPTPFVVYHDAYQYLEARFGLNGAGAIALSDAADPSAARLSALRDDVARDDIACVFAEPQFDPGLVESVFGDTEARIAVLDPLGTGIAPGTDFYPAFLRSIAVAMEECLKG